MSEDMAAKMRADIKENVDKGKLVQTLNNICIRCTDGVYIVYRPSADGDTEKRTIILQTADGDQAVRKYMSEAYPF